MDTQYDIIEGWDYWCYFYKARRNKNTNSETLIDSGKFIESTPGLLNIGTKIDNLSSSEEIIERTVIAIKPKIQRIHNQCVPDYVSLDLSLAAIVMNDDADRFVITVKPWANLNGTSWTSDTVLTYWDLVGHHVPFDVDVEDYEKETFEKIAILEQVEYRATIEDLSQAFGKFLENRSTGFLITAEGGYSGIYGPTYATIASRPQFSVSQTIPGRTQARILLSTEMEAKSKVRGRCKNRLGVPITGVQCRVTIFNLSHDRILGTGLSASSDGSFLITVNVKIGTRVIVAFAETSSSISGGAIMLTESYHLGSSSSSSSSYSSSSSSSSISSSSKSSSSISSSSSSNSSSSSSSYSSSSSSYSSSSSSFSSSSSSSSSISSSSSSFSSSSQSSSSESVSSSSSSSESSSSSRSSSSSSSSSSKSSSSVSSSSRSSSSSSSSSSSRSSSSSSSSSSLSSFSSSSRSSSSTSSSSSNYSSSSFSSSSSSSSGSASSSSSYSSSSFSVAASGIFYPSESGDDGYRDDDTFVFGADIFYIGNVATEYKDSWVRFVGITIPQGSTIVSAFIRFTSSTSLSSTTVNANIYFNDADDAVAPSNNVDFLALSLTSAYSAWDNISTWAQDSTYDTPSLVSVLQEVVDRGGFSSGNAVMAIVKDNGSTDHAYRTPVSIVFYGGIYKAELHVTWMN